MPGNKKLREVLEGVQGAELVTLEPGKWWFVLPLKGWKFYGMALAKAYGAESFRTIQTTERNDDTWFFEESEGEFVFVVISVRTPIVVNAQIVGIPREWEPGMSAVTEGIRDQPDPALIHTANEVIDEAKSAAKSIASFGTPLLYAAGFAALAIAWAVRK